MSRDPRSHAGFIALLFLPPLVVLAAVAAPIFPFAVVDSRGHARECTPQAYPCAVQPFLSAPAAPSSLSILAAQVEAAETERGYQALGGLEIAARAAVLTLLARVFEASDERLAPTPSTHPTPSTQHAPLSIPHPAGAHHVRGEPLPENL